MIDERKLLDALNAQKRLLKDDPLKDGKYCYAVLWTAVTAEIQRLSGTRWIGGDENGQPEEEKRLQAIHIQRTDNDDP